MGAGVVHLAWPEFLAHRPVTAVALCPAPGQAQALVAYGPVGAQLGAAQLLQVRAHARVEGRTRDAVALPV